MLYLFYIFFSSLVILFELCNYCRLNILVCIRGLTNSSIAKLKFLQKYLRSFKLNKAILRRFYFLCASSDARIR